MGLPDQADTLLREAALVQKRMVSQAVRFLTEQEQTEYATRFVENLDVLFQDYGTRHPNDVAIGLDLTLFQRALSSASQQLRNRVQQIPKVRTMYQDPADHAEEVEQRICEACPGSQGYLRSGTGCG